MQYAIIWMTLSCVTAISLAQIGWITYLRLVRQGIQTKGTVVQMFPESHALIKYEYEVGGRKFEGLTQSRPPNPPIRDLSIGQRLIVYYYPKDPAQSIIGSPHYQLRNETISIALVAIVLPTSIVLAWRYGMLFQRPFQKKGG
jgi:hypothetical protein